MATPDPSSVHPEYDRPTPQNEDEWTEEQLEAWSEAKSEQLAADAQERQEELAEEHAAALEKLRDPDDVPTDMAELQSGEKIEVKTVSNKQVDEKLDAMQHAEDAMAVRGDIIDVICWFVVEDDLSQRVVWEEYADRWGVAELMKEAIRIIEPFFDSAEGDEVVEKFRQKR